MRNKFFLPGCCMSAFIAFVFFMGVGCKKSNPNYYYISYEVNGVRHVDTSQTLALMYADDTLNSYSAHLSACIAPSGNMIAITILSKTPLNTTTVYKDTTQTFGTLVDIDYYDSPYNFPGHPAMSSYKLFPRNVVIHFNNISANSVEGTFSADIASAYNAPVTSITNGAFYLKVH